MCAHMSVVVVEWHPKIQPAQPERLVTCSVSHTQSSAAWTDRGCKM